MPTAVHWSPADKDLVVSGDERGTLAIWRLSASTVNLFTPEDKDANIFCLACSPHNSGHVAVG